MSFSTALNLKICISMTPTTLPSRAISPRPAHLLAPGYVEMPQSRVGKFFGKFRRKKKEEEESASEWLGVGDDFDAREVGKRPRCWESFRDEDDDWNGGAFSNMRAARLGEANGPLPTMRRLRPLRLR